MIVVRMYFNGSDLVVCALNVMRISRWKYYLVVCALNLVGNHRHFFPKVCAAIVYYSLVI